MKRVRLFELEDQRWLPASIRDAGTDVLRSMTEVGNIYGAIVPKLKDALVKTASQEVLDLCSGGGGPTLRVREALVKAGCSVAMTLSDKFPNRAAFEYLRKRSGEGVDFVDQPVDAAEVPPHLSGFRTLFTSFHHFPPETARSVLLDAVRQRRPIGIFDMSARKPPPLGVILLANPVAHLLTTPFIRPFRWSRLFWTYVVPLVPLYVAWDGFASGFRLYSTQELQELVDGLHPHASDYVWEIGRKAFPHSITYLIGYPKA